MRSTVTWLLAVGLLAIAWQSPSAAQEDAATIDADQVNAAIKRGIAYLKREQTGNGSWAELHGFERGMSSLATLALLSAGVPPDDETVQKSLTSLRKMEVGKGAKTYTVALQTMVLCAAEPAKDMILIRRNVKWLEETQLKRGDQNGSWSYPGQNGDNSNSQFAVMALYEAERVGVKVAGTTWERAHRYWREAQNYPGDGSWGYQFKNAGTGSMTCAGIAALVITSGKVSGGDAEIVDGAERCCGEGQSDDQLETALHWLGEAFAVDRNPRAGALPRFWLYYYLYGLERVGRLTNRRFIGQHDWYREGATFLVKAQDPLSGYWKGLQHPESNPVIGTSMALLFLSKGRRPVVISKLKFGEGDDWNHHRRDLAHLTEFAEKQWKRDLTWQVINGDAAKIDDLLETPVLFITGSRAPNALLKDAPLLREYLNRGGFIFAEACCRDSQAFDEGFRKLMDTIFPEAEYKLNELAAPDHAIWRAELPVNPKYARRLEGIDYGCRTCVVYAPPDESSQRLNALSCYWELGGGRRETKLPDEVQRRVDAANAIGINVLTYATNREPKYKNPFQKPIENELAKIEDARGTLYVAKLKHPGGCNAAPAALINLLRAAETELQMSVSDQDRQLVITDEGLFRHHLVFMHGRHRFQLTEEERQQLALFLERGGMIFADSICASKEFSESFRTEIGLIVKRMQDAKPSGGLERIPVNDPLFTKEFGGYDLRKVSRRDPGTRTRGQPLRAVTRETEPDLEGLKIHDRYAVIFSPYDISCALEKQVSLECDGYIPRDAARIGLNVLLYSLHR